MSKYTFTKVPDPNNRFDFTTVTVELEADGLQDLIEAFEEFLAGCSFSRVKIETVDPDEAFSDKEEEIEE